MIQPDELPITDLHRHLGAVRRNDGSIQWTIWSPTASRVEVVSSADRAAIEMTRLDSGYHVGVSDQWQLGDAYGYSIDGGPLRPDPASRFQVDSVHGPSQIVDRRFDWSDQDWRPPRMADWVIYELHIGTFTADGTYRSAEQRIDELIELGINAIELMPVADCAGRWNWGYDGVHLFAPNRNYGSPDELRRFIDTCHRKGVAVILDVVYNHLGPEGNYLGQLGPYLSPRHETVWGSAPNFDDEQHGTECQRFFIANALYWYDEFHFDGLRVDAIHCMKDDSAVHVAAKLSDAVREYELQSGRTAMLIAESNVYDPEMVLPRDQGGIGFDAQWSDDFVHSLYAAIRPGESLSDRMYRAGSDLQQTLESGYVYRGTIGSFRQRIESPRVVDPTYLIRCIQNHDFIGNHPLGKRISDLTSPGTQMAAAALLILSPSIPMLFMGEEFACRHPFGFFVDFEDADLQANVRAGRRREYPQHDWSAGIEATDPAAMHNSRIGPITDQRMWDWYRDLIQLRKDWKSCGLLDFSNCSVHCDPDANLYETVYRAPDGERIAGVQIGLNRIVDDVVTPPPPHVRDSSRQVIHDSRQSCEDSSWAIVWQSPN